MNTFLNLYNACCVRGDFFLATWTSTEGNNNQQSTTTTSQHTSGSCTPASNPTPPSRKRLSSGGVAMARNRSNGGSLIPNSELLIAKLQNVAIHDKVKDEQQQQSSAHEASGSSKLPPITRRFSDAFKCVLKISAGGGGGAEGSGSNLGSKRTSLDSTANSTEITPTNTSTRHQDVTQSSPLNPPFITEAQLASGEHVVPHDFATVQLNVDRILSLYNIKHSWMNAYCIKCHKSTIEFHIEIVKVEGLKTPSVVLRFDRKKGIAWLYQSFVAKLEQEMRTF